MQINNKSYYLPVIKTYTQKMAKVPMAARMT